MDWGVGVLTDVVGLVKAKYSFDLVECDVLLYLYYVWVQILNVVDIHKYESLLKVKTESDDVLDVVNCHFPDLFKLKFWPVQEFLIISYLDYDRDIKSFLEILAENKGDCMA